jgi:hypothetical protein
MQNQDARTKNSRRQQWQSLADELRRTQDVDRMRELVMLLEEAVFDRQQEPALDADKIDKRAIEEKKKV